MEGCRALHVRVPFRQDAAATTTTVRFPGAIHGCMLPRGHAQAGARQDEALKPAKVLLGGGGRYGAGVGTA